MGRDIPFNVHLGYDGLLGLLLVHLARFLIIYISFALYCILDLFIYLHFSKTFLASLDNLLPLYVFALFRIHLLEFFFFLGLFTLGCLRVLTRALHDHENLWADQHILDSFLVNSVLVIIDAIVVFNCLGIEQEKIIDSIDGEFALVYLQLVLEHVLREVRRQESFLLHS